MLLVVLIPLPAAAQSVVELLQRPGHIGFMRHALAPFEGAPKGHVPTSELADCTRQRNLDAVGRADARRIGALFRDAGLAFDRVYTSAMCRCRETAALIIGREAENLPLIDSYFTNPDKSLGPRQLAALKVYLDRDLPPEARVLMVTHGSLISDLTGIDTEEVEIVVVVRDGRGGVRVVGRGIPGRPGPKG
jgi:broad specificity phosphatase PhoE